ncbi:MAG: NADH-quinone oxidoreductase subunit NuoK [Cytophagaceae bacterium]|nr:NADH-quinone oxidoreductase subunit NuoK [Cytophagaceae bacterium]MDW8457164.1 NADH-quinone oxidoreductase subunit NuoK [Cytophagaceae bacterium]
MIPLHHILILSVLLFTTGVYVVISRKNAIHLLIGIELIFLSASMNFIAFSYHDPSLLQGQVFSLFIIIVAAAESSLVLAMLLQVVRHFRSIDIDKVNDPKE